MRFYQKCFSDIKMIIHLVGANFRAEVRKSTEISMEIPALEIRKYA